MTKQNIQIREEDVVAGRNRILEYARKIDLAMTEKRGEDIRVYFNDAHALLGMWLSAVRVANLTNEERDLYRAHLKQAENTLEARREKIN